MDSLFYRKIRSGFQIREVAKKLLKNKRATIKIVAGIVLAMYILLGNHGVVQRMRLSGEKAELLGKIERAEAENRNLRATAKALEGDRMAIEKVARERYGMIREGETVYKITTTK